MIKHVLPAWGIHGPKRSWWYKMNLFDSAEHAGPLLYFDLDTVIVNNIDWICDLPLSYFWAVQDFRYLQRPTHLSMNSSIMWWDTRRFNSVWTAFQQENLGTVMKKYRGDQDYLDQVLDKDLRFLDPGQILSWRWQCLGKGYNFKRRNYQSPEIVTHIPAEASVLIFHGHPKPDKIQDPVLNTHWQ
jgi:lipopolysaccharide biosynthesis glycosyltransferase